MKDTERKNAIHPQFMSSPSLACPAEYRYCFGPHHVPTMQEVVADAVMSINNAVLKS